MSVGSTELIRSGGAAFAGAGAGSHWATEGCPMSRRLDGGDQGAEAPAFPAPERSFIGDPEVAL